MIIRLANMSRRATLRLRLKCSSCINGSLPTPTIGAAFVLSSILGLLVVSGILLKPYAVREVVMSWHDRVQMEIEYRELSRIRYSVIKAAFSKDD